MVHYHEKRERSKNPGTALLLALLLGPIGMFYATVTWAAIMLFINVILGAITYGLVIIVLWPVGARIAYRAVCTHNQKILRQTNGHIDVLPSLVNKHPQRINAHNAGIVYDDDYTATLSPNEIEDKTFKQAQVLARFGGGLIRVAAEKFLPNDLAGNWIKNAFKKMGPNFRLQKPSPLFGHTPQPNKKAIGELELRMMTLKNLREKGLIDELEFNCKKKSILDEL